MKGCRNGRIFVPYYLARVVFRYKTQKFNAVLYAGVGILALVLPLAFPDDKSSRLLTYVACGISALFCFFMAWLSTTIQIVVHADRIERITGIGTHSVHFRYVQRIEFSLSAQHPRRVFFRVESSEKALEFHSELEEFERAWKTVIARCPGAAILDRR